MKKRDMTAAVMLLAVLAVLAGCMQAPAAGQTSVNIAPEVARDTTGDTGTRTAVVPGGNCVNASDDTCVFLTYHPRKCEKTPWMAWEEASGRRYIRAPGEAEIIAHYYAAEHGVTVSDVAKAYLHMASCEACDVCRESYWFQLTVGKDGVHPLVDDGWQPAA